MLQLSRKKPDTKDPMLYNPLSMKCPEQANPERLKVDPWLPGAGWTGDLGGLWLRGVWFLFRAKENGLKLTMVMGMHNCILKAAA